MINDCSAGSKAKEHIPRGIRPGYQCEVICIGSGIGTRHKNETRPYFLPIFNSRISEIVFSDLKIYVCSSLSQHCFVGASPCTSTTHSDRAIFHSSSDFFYWESSNSGGMEGDFPWGGFWDCWSEGTSSSHPGSKRVYNSLCRRSAHSLCFMRVWKRKTEVWFQASGIAA